MRKVKPKYITVPIGLLREIHTDPKGTIGKMFDYGIYDRMRKNYPILEHEDFDDDTGIEESMEYFELNPKNGATELETGKTLYDKFQGTPNASINIYKLLEFQEGKTEFELMAFCFYCAIRSIIGTQAFYHSKTKKGEPDFWFVRAFGYSSKEEFRKSNPAQAEKDLRVKYSNRYWFELVKKTLQNDWYLVYVSTNKHIKMRGYYVSFKLSLEALAKVAKIANDEYKSKETVRKETLARVFG